MVLLIGFTNVAKVLVLNRICLAYEQALPGVRGWGGGGSEGALFPVLRTALHVHRAFYYISLSFTAQLRRETH